MNLEWLDLSFNLITHIEGLDSLTKLTDLSLYSNKITEIGGLERLTELNVFSFGKNLVKNHQEALLYLKRQKNRLEVLKMAENPFVKVGGQNPEDYKLLAIEWLKGLKYLDYELITEDDRNNAKTKFSEGENLEKGDKDGVDETDIFKQVD